MSCSWNGDEKLVRSGETGDNHNDGGGFVDYENIALVLQPCPWYMIVVLIIFSTFGCLTLSVHLSITVHKMFVDNCP